MASVRNLVSAELAGALLTLFFAWTVTKCVRSTYLESKRIVIHRDQATHPLF